MNCRIARLLALTLALLPTAAFSTLQAQSQPNANQTLSKTEQWQQDLAAWRAQREQQVSAPDGWLTLAGLEWLKPGFNSVGSAADNNLHLPSTAPAHLGLLTVSGKTIQLLAPTGGFPADLKIDGNPAREGSINIANAKPSTIAWHGLTMVVLSRADRFVLRIKDADSPARAAFHGLNWYAPDPHFHVTARWIPFTPQHIEKIPTILGTTLDLPSPGVAEFTIGDKIMRLQPVIEDPSGQILFFILRDETSKTATYGGGRFLHTGLPDNGLDQPGLLTLDFNRLENPPCAYTNFATCPLPPEQNQLAIPLEAGEKRYAQ